MPGRPGTLWAAILSVTPGPPGYVFLAWSMFADPHGFIFARRCAKGQVQLVRMHIASPDRAPVHVPDRASDGAPDRARLERRSVFSAVAPAVSVRGAPIRSRRIRRDSQCDTQCDTQCDFRAVSVSTLPTSRALSVTLSVLRTEAGIRMARAPCNARRIGSCTG